MKQYVLPIIASAILSSCSSGGPDRNWVAQLDAAGRDRNAVWLAGDGSKGEHYGFTSYAAASSVVEANKGKVGTLSGYIWDVQVTGNKVAIEVIPNFSGSNAKRCTGDINQHRLDCLEQRRGFFKSNVTCHINNLKEFYGAGGKRIGEDIPKKWEAPFRWNHVAVQGKIKNIEVKGAKFGRYYGGQSSLSFGDTGGSYTDGFRYNSIHLDSCRVLTFNGKAIIPHS